MWNTTTLSLYLPGAAAGHVPSHCNGFAFVKKPTFLLLQTHKKKDTSESRRDIITNMVRERRQS
jgi:hypothetical protein